VGLFAPPEDISAATMLETLYFYALAHQVGVITTAITVTAGTAIDLLHWQYHVPVQEAVQRAFVCRTGVPHAAVHVEHV
jgi:hypothetical protein